MDVSDSRSRDCCVLHSCHKVQRKGPRFPENVCPEWKIRTKESRRRQAAVVGAWQREIDLKEKERERGPPFHSMSMCPWSGKGSYRKADTM